MAQKAFKVSRTNRLGFTLGSLALACLFVFLAYLGQRFIVYLNQAEKTQSVLHKITSISVLLERSEAGFRGYLYTQDPRLLKRYHLASGSIQSDIETLKNAVSENQSQVDLVRKLRDLVKALYRDHDETIKNFKIAGKNQMSESLLRGHMLEIRSTLENLEAEETRILSDRKLESDILFNSGLTVLVLGALTGLALMIWSRRQLSQTAKSEFAQNSLLNSIIENLNDGMTVLDADGSVRFVNSELEKLLGFSIKGLKLENREQLFSCFHPVTRQVLLPAELPLARALRGETIDEFELIIQTHHSTKDIVVSACARPIYDETLKIIGAMCIYRDITKRKRIEEEWQKAREAALDTARLKSDFLTQLSHEIRTPMNGVIGMSNLLINSQLGTEQKTFVKNIQVSAHYLLNMIQSVSDQSLVEKGIFKLHAAPFRLVDCILHIIAILEPAAENRQIKLFLDSEVEADLEVISDSTRLQAVLIDALEKSLASTEKGFVSLKVKVLEVFDGKARFYFEIKNSGSNVNAGVSEQNRAKDQMIREIVRQLDGETESEYQEGFGNRYSLTVDLSLKRSNEKKIVKRHAQIMADKPILVAEDQSINQMVIKKYLERFGLQCHIVSDGQSAFLEATTGKYCLVLMDCKMQPINGYEATQLIRTHEKRLGSRIPIIALTADGSIEDRRRCEQVGMDDYVVKPIDLEKLENTLHKWIQPVLKEEYIKKLDGYQLEGKPLLQVLAEDYFETTPRLIDNLEKAMVADDIKQTQYFSHTLKSSSITLGLVELSGLCQKLESMNQIEPVAKLVLGQIKESYKRSEPLLRRRLQVRSI